VDKITKNAWKKYVKTINMKGFRKGKMSKSVMEGIIGKTNIYSEILSSTANLKFTEVYPTKIIFTDYHEVEKLSNGNYIVKFVAWEEPKVTMDDSVVAKTDFDIKGKFDIDRYIDDRMNGFVKLHPYLHAKVDNADNSLPSAPGDMVEARVECWANGNKFVDGCEEATNLRLIEGTINPPELYDQLLNRRSGAEFSIITKEVPKAFSKELMGKIVEIRVKINHIYSCEEAKLDDDMAITAGYKTLDDWKSAIKIQAEKLKENFDKTNKGQTILNYLVALANITPFPPGWISIKAMELKAKDPNIASKIEEVARQISVLKYVGEKIGIEWTDADKKLSNRNEAVYAQRVLDVLVERSTFNYVDS
jgi:trigger factor